MRRIGRNGTRVSTTRALAVLLIGLASAAAVRCDAEVFVSVAANPTTISGDGKSCSQILVTVLGQTGAPAQDDTEVRLTTSAGDITPVVYTTSGRAVAILTSSSCPQIATVSAIANGGSGSAQVEFASSGDERVGGGAGTIRMTGGSLAYSIDTDTILGSGGVTLEYKGLMIDATGAQVCQTSGQIRAQGRVSVHKGSETLTADALACDMRSDRITLLDSNDQSSTRTFAVAKLKPIEEKGTSGQDLGSLANANGKNWIVCQRLDLIPGEKILFFKASIYVGDSKVVKMPYYSYSYEKRESILQQVRYTSSDGILVDLPFYYRMTDSGTGALKFRYAGNGDEAGGYSRPRKGLSMGLEQEYSIADRSRGRVFVDALGSSSQAFELAHHFEFGSLATGGRADISAHYQPFSSYARGLHNATLNVAGGLRNYNYSISGYLGGSSIPRFDPLDPENMSYFTQSSCTLRAVLRPKTPIISRGLGRISPSFITGYGNLVTSSGLASSSCLFESLGLSSSRGSSGNGRVGLSFDGTTAFTMTARGETGAGIHVGPTLRTRWGYGNASLRYTLNVQGGTTDAASALARHQLGLNLFLNPGSRLNTSSSINYGLDSGRLNLYSSLNYRLMKRWQIRSEYSLYRYAYRFNNSLYRYGTSYLKIGAYHPLGMYEVGLAWSPNGQDFGIDKSRHIWLELNGGRF